MRTLRILFAKELNATLTSPIGYTVAAVFLLVLGYTFSLTLFVTKVANLQYIFHQMYVLSILLVPVLTMRTFAEERRSETLELLLTAPVRELSVVLAKYAATLTLVIGIFALTLVYAVILDEPTNGLDPRQIIEMRELIRSLAGRHTVLMSSHILSEVEKTSDRVAVLLNGRLLGVRAIADTPDLEGWFLSLT